MIFYRVFPWIEGAGQASPGGALFIPTQGTGRIDNPDRYAAVYASDSPAGAIAEIFNRSPYKLHWTTRMLRPRLDRATTAIAELAPRSERFRLCNLDDPRELVSRKLRPSRVATRDREITQAWALSIFKQRRYAGVRWWSYHEARWGSIGCWDFGALEVVAVHPLTLDDPSLREAAGVLAISIDLRR